ncbi:MAG: 5-methylcytosine-specific restriction endonuclease system specificity protein McrC [Acidobacteriia bacterium]|nr:5-methylcytosine-specific restriction endonuclease system specificity protein McrC [Terriglobia bacterium]
MPIPIQNIYFLLCYAWDKLDEAQLVDVSGVDSTELADLFATVLLTGTKRLFREGMDRGYRPFSEDTSSPRGRIDFSVSLKRCLFQQAKACCRFDDLNHNVLHNRILKSTIGRLKKTENLDGTLASQLAQLHRRFNDVEEIELTPQTFRQVQLHRNNAFYVFLMDVCELVSTSLLPDETSGSYRFRNFLRDEGKMNRLFERFVSNFYHREQEEFGVKRDIILWDAKSVDKGSFNFLPQMETDISLRSKQRTIIIDTKYYESTLQRSQFGKESVHSENLYQIFSYLKNLEVRPGPDSNAEGLLLYPTTSKSVDLQYEIQGHTLRVCTLNLDQEWRNIRQELFGFLKPHETATLEAIPRV